MTKFVMIGNAIVNVDLICAVTERYVTEIVPSNDDLPFDDTRQVVKGVNVFFADTTEDSFIPFEDETVESFFEKITGAAQ